MKKLAILIAIPLFTWALQAQVTPPPQAQVQAQVRARSQTPQFYNVRCPECLTKQTLKATWVGSSGGTACTTNINGVEVKGCMQQMTAQFHCNECHYDFSAPIKPDKFVPTYPAEPAVAAGPVIIDQPTPPPTPPAAPSFGPATVGAAGQTEVSLADGSVLIISAATLPNEVVLRTIQLNDGSMLNIYLRPKK